VSVLNQKKHHIYWAANSFGVSRYIRSVGTIFHETHFANNLGMVEAHPMSCPCAAIMGCDEKRFMAQVVHHFDLIRRHRPKEVILVACTALFA
jgi:hypothetical protein